MQLLLRYKIYIAIGVALLVVVVGGVWYFSRGGGPSYDLALAERADVVQEVSVSGSVKPAQRADLAFEQGGRLVTLNVAVGSHVSAGEILGSLYNNDLLAQLSQAEADVKVEQAKLDELLRGTRPEELTLQEIKVSNSTVSLDEAKKNLRDKLHDAYTKSDDAIRNRVDQFMSNPRSSNPQLSFTLSDKQLENDIEWQRTVVEGVLSVWSASLDSLDTNSNLDAYVTSAKSNLDKIKTLLDRVALAVNSLVASSDLSQTKLDGWKSDVSTGRTNVNTAINNISAAEDKWRTAQSDLSVAEQELRVLQAGTTEEELRAERALLERAEANVKNIQAKISKTVLRSPISGTVTAKNAELGEIVAADKTVFSVMSAADFMLEANVPEVDIAKVKVGDLATVTLDAYGSDVIFNAKVSKIDPAEIVIEGVPTYKVTLELSDKNGRIRSGMSANIDIMTARQNGVIAIPYRAILSKNGDKFVRVLHYDGTVEERKVEIGLRGSYGNAEVVSGVAEGEKIIVFIK